MTEEENEEREYINRTRIACIRLLKKELGDNFSGGLSDSLIARELAPDLILPAEKTKRPMYIRNMQGYDVCIGSMGLYGSIGGKIGEYVAASRGIVCEEQHYTVPGNFADGVNYLGFTTADECVEKVMLLTGDPDRLFKMKKANEEYYRDSLHPYKLIKNSLEKVMEKE